MLLCTILYRIRNSTVSVVTLLIICYTHIYMYTITYIRSQNARTRYYPTRFSQGRGEKIEVHKNSGPGGKSPRHLPPILSGLDFPTDFTFCMQLSSFK